ncbi:MAG: IS200/IS605 family transposase [Xenococcaceae cyanobacterium]
MEGKTTLKTHSHSAFRLYYHLVLVTRYRHKCITAPMLERLEDIFNEVLAKWRCNLVEFGGESDHIHILIDAHPAMDLSKLVNNLKTVSSRRIRSEYSDHLSRFYGKPYFWTRGYAIISVGGRAPLEKLLEYIQTQDSPEAPNK